MLVSSLVDEGFELQVAYKQPAGAYNYGAVTFIATGNVRLIAVTSGE